MNPIEALEKYHEAYTLLLHLHNPLWCKPNRDAGDLHSEFLGLVYPLLANVNEPTLVQRIKRHAEALGESIDKGEHGVPFDRRIDINDLLYVEMPMLARILLDDAKKWVIS